jgi:hypothetical protein
MNDLSNELNGVISQMLKPLKGLSLEVIIEGISGHKIIPFNKTDPKDQQILEILEICAKNVKEHVNNKINGISRNRVNEVGNDIEPIVEKELNNIGYKSNRPTTQNGHKKSSGYPDLEFIDKFGNLNYLECKTFNIKNINTTQRSFYLSPSKNFKILQDAHHFGISFEVYEEQSNIYKIKSWKILDLSKLTLNVKYEFNSDNKHLYNKELILAEGN